VGTEVLVAFMGGDPDRPIVLSQLYNGRAQPPALSRTGDLPGNRYLAGMRSREIGGARGGQLLFDDTPGQIGVQLASDHGEAQLNLGWMSEPRLDGQGAPRGEGAELRSSKAVAVRGGEGVLISAGGKAGDATSQLERSGLVGIADLMHSVLDELGRLAAEHGEDEQAKPRLAELAGRLRSWQDGTNVAPESGQGRQPMVAVTAPASVVLASDDSIALGAQAKIDLVSGGDAEMATGGSLFLRAARKLSLFAHELGLKLTAGRGNVTIEAHQGAVAIKSSGRISLISGEAVYIEAPIVRVVAQGAQTEWCEGRLTQQSSGEHVIKAASIVRAGPVGGNPSAPDLGASAIHTDERLVLRHLQTREPIPAQRYIAHLEDGRTIEGMSDEHGRTALVHSDTLGPVRFEILP